MDWEIASADKTGYLRGMRWGMSTRVDKGEGNGSGKGRQDRGLRHVYGRLGEARRFKPSKMGAVVRRSSASPCTSRANMWASGDTENGDFGGMNCGFKRHYSQRQITVADLPVSISLRCDSKNSIHAGFDSVKGRTAGNKMPFGNIECQNVHGSFVGALGAGRYSVPPQNIKFQSRKVTTSSGSFSAHMVAECKKVGMKPVCEHPSYCRTDKQALYMGQYYHVSYRPYRNINSWFPQGWDKFRDDFYNAGEQMCFYAGNNRGNAYCNIPFNSHAWKNPKDVQGGSFMCGVVTKDK